MSVTGDCPRCDFESAQFLNIGSNASVAVDCPPRRGCNFQAAVSVEKAIELIDDAEFPLQLE